MGHIRFRSAVSPLRRRAVAEPVVPPVGLVPANDFAADAVTVDAVVASRRPADPVHCLRPAVFAAQAAAFVAAFPGDVLYAVKCNPEPAVLRALYQGGIRHFDAASPGEIRLVRQMFPDAEIHYMHPVKSRAAIREAYFQYGVRDFVLDSAEELVKLFEETDHATDLGVVVRLGLPKGNAVYDLSGKFGAAPDVAVGLLRAARQMAPKLGLSFHVGSQMLEPADYERALALAGQVLDRAGVQLDVLDVGGGFPVSYPGVTPPPLGDFMAAIRRGVDRLGLPASCRLWCEPGRALVAPGASVVVQVLLRRGDMLFVNDGVYGSLSDAGIPAFRFPARMIRPEAASAAPLTGFGLFGPTCDTADRMAGPFLLPADIEEGDWIEIGQLGAYGTALRTAFNGFDRAEVVEVADGPMLATPGYALPEPVV